MQRQSASSQNVSLFASKPETDTDLSALMLTDPDKFMSAISKRADYLTPEFARKLDSLDPLNYTAALFNTGNLVPFAGHSLGPVFQPVLDKISATADLQKQLHAGHFSSAHEDAANNSHWFECDRNESAVRAAQQLLGFKHPDEFIFTAAGLSENLARLLDTFFRPGKKDWENGKSKILMLATDFFSDQAVVASVMRRTIKTAEAFDMFAPGKTPDPESQIIKIHPDVNGIYHTQDIIAAIKLNASAIKVICLSDIVFGTGQRLELNKIFAAVKDDIERNDIIIGLDLAHTIGNRAINLASFPVPIHFAVACAYKHLCGFAGSGFGIYVNKAVDLTKYPPLQGWKAADPARVFAVINQYDAKIMAQSGAVAFRLSNPPPVALHPVQVFLTYFAGIGFTKCFNKSECMTRYLLVQLQKHLGEQLEFLTPFDPAQRGAMIVFRVKGLSDVQAIEHGLKEYQDGGMGYEIDTRPPNNIRLTAHYAYTKFEHIAQVAARLKQVIDRQYGYRRASLTHSRSHD